MGLESPTAGTTGEMPLRNRTPSFVVRTAAKGVLSERTKQRFVCFEIFSYLIRWARLSVASLPISSF